MILNLYSIKDKLSDFKGVLTIQDDENAVRIFEAFCKKQKTIEYLDAKYFDLYKLGTMDSETGEIKALTKQEIKLIKEGEQYDEQKA